MATKICFTGDFKVTCEYGRSGTAWKSGYHQGIDLVGITSQKVYSICNGIVERAGYDKGGFGNYVRIKENGTEKEKNNNCRSNCRNYCRYCNFNRHKSYCNYVRYQLCLYAKKYYTYR